MRLYLFSGTLWQESVKALLSGIYSNSKGLQKKKRRLICYFSSFYGGSGGVSVTGKCSGLFANIFKSKESDPFV